MFTISGSVRPAAEAAGASCGVVRNASTSNLLSFEMNVNDSTSASGLPVSTALFRSVSLRALPPVWTYSSARSDGLA